MRKLGLLFPILAIALLVGHRLGTRRLSPQR